MARKKEPFYYFMIDNDQLKFNIIGPTYISSIWDTKLGEAIKQNRNLYGDIIHGEENKKRIMNDWIGKGYELTENLLVDQPEDKSKEFKGLLPDYAKNADRNRIVRYHCDKCGTGRFLLLNKNFPGIEELHSAVSGFYKATCLKCGDTLSDNYNWYR